MKTILALAALVIVYTVLMGWFWGKYLRFYLRETFKR